MTRSIAIIGNPNSGKTTLFNLLTGARQKVGNWSGVTVAKKTGKFVHQGETVKVTDLPGVYSLSVPSIDSALDEKIACQYIQKHPDLCYINIIDAANLKRNLYLTLQLLEMRVPVIVVVNMMDVARQRGVQIDLDGLSRALGCPVLPMIGHKGVGLSALKKTIATCDVDPANYVLPALPAPIQDAVQTLAGEVGSNWRALRLLERDVLVASRMDEAILSCANKKIALLEQDLGEAVDLLVADVRYRHIHQLVSGCVRRVGTPRQHTLSDRLDQVIMHRWLGIPIFLLVMYLLFEISMNLGTLFQPFFDISSTTLFIDGANYLGAVWHWPGWLTLLLSQGVGVGINTVLNFVPQIAFLFLFLSFLEDSGYMARAAFVMDRFMQSVGLPGKSFIPLIVGFGCNVPSIMATRNLEHRRDRILTAMMAPFMSCGARLAIFVVFVSAFFPRHGGLVLFLLYMTGILVALLTGLLLKKTLLKGMTAPFILEIPPYHRPTLRILLRLTWQRLQGFIVRAGRYIVPICVLIGGLNALPVSGSMNASGRSESVLSVIGQDLAPILAPMGIRQDNWPAAVGLVTGVLAKEVVVGTLNTLYTKTPPQSDWVHTYSLWHGLQSAVTVTLRGFSSALQFQRMNPFTVNEADHTLSKSAMGTMQHAFSGFLPAFAYLLFILLYVPCVSTVATLAREIGRGWAVFSTSWSLFVGYWVAVFFYQTATWLQHPISASAWLLSLALAMAGVMITLSRVQRRGRLAC